MENAGNQYAKPQRIEENIKNKENPSLSTSESDIRKDEEYVIVCFHEEEENKECLLEIPNIFDEERWRS